MRNTAAPILAFAIVWAFFCLAPIAFVYAGWCFVEWNIMIPDKDFRLGVSLWVGLVTFAFCLVAIG